jgi:hypothetical protein
MYDLLIRHGHIVHGTVRKMTLLPASRLGLTR